VTGLRRVLLVAAVIAGIAIAKPVQPGHPAGEPRQAAVVDSPEFEVTLRGRAVTITGHTRSQRHEQRLRSAAADMFPGAELRFEFRAYGPAPDWWPAATIALASAAAATRAANARLDGSAVVLRALSDQPGRAAQRVAELVNGLPAAVTADIRIRDAGAGVDARALCERQFRTFHNGPINFVESETAMRPSAYPELDRVVALADACRGATVSITGHSDASGNEEWNRQLSLGRARAVANWLAQRGVDANRIVAQGRGSSEPIADNATRYGRSLNRRIEIAFSYAD